MYINGPEASSRRSRSGATKTTGTTDVEVTDVNGDGIDLVVGNEDAPDMVYLGRRTSTSPYMKNLAKNSEGDFGRLR